MFRPMIFNALALTLLLLIIWFGYQAAHTPVTPFPPISEGTP
jgi:TRAP-type C4-dicarboxylate transport system permease small subunit